jgi:hypothetical protein
MKKLVLLSAACFHLGFTGANAIDIAVESDIPNDFSGTPKDPLIEVKGMRTSEKRDRNTSVFNLSIPETSAIEVLSINLPSGKIGYADYEGEFDVLFRDNRAKFWASIVKRGSSDQDTRDFQSEASIKQSGPDLFNFNQRARVLFRARQESEVEPTPEDVAVAYWLVQSTAALVSSSRMVVDSDSRAAAAKLDEWTTSDTYVSRTFFKKNPGITSENIKFAIKALNDRDRSIRAPAITSLDDSLVRSSTRIDACRRLPSLRAVFDDERSRDEARYNGWYWQYALLVGTVLKCDYIQILNVKTQAQPVLSDTLENVNFDLQDFASIVQSYRTSVDQNPNRDRDVQKRIGAASDLAKLVGLSLPDELLVSK